MKAKEVLKEVLNTLNTLQYREKVIIEYAKAKCKEQREICSNKCVGIWTESELVDRVLESETPDFK